jgi:hypothetical protein
MEFINVEGFTVRVNISPTDVLIPDIDTPVIIPLTGSGTPVVISASDNDQDKFTQIRSKSAKIQFVTNTAAGLDSSTFSQGGDNLWVCDIILQDTPQYIFRGFLMMADNQQPFQPDPQYVTLTATDHLAALKEVALQDLAGLNPIGKYRVADLINFCLRKTGLTLDFFVVNNLRAGGGQFTNAALFSSSGNYIVTSGLVTKFFYPGQEFTVTGTATHDGTYHVDYVVNTVVSEVHTVETISAPGETATTTFTDTASASHWYDVVYLDAKTFEKEIGLSEDCYTVLQKILGEDCFITQWHGSWWIFRVDEMEDNPLYIAEFTSAGVYVSTATDVIDKSIGFTEDSKFANADTLLRFVRPHGFVKETFNFSSPLENPCNSDFVRGALTSTISQYEKRYDLDCWTLLAGFPGGYISVDGTTVYLQRNFNINGYESERFIVLTPRTTFESGSSQPTYIESAAIPVLVNDKFSASIDYQLTSFTAGLASQRLFRMILHGNDGSYWILGRPSDFAGTDDTPTWYDTAGWTLFTGAGKTTVDFANEDWNSIAWEAPPVPVSGDLFIWINQLNQNSAAYDSHDIRYNNLQFTYIPYINGSYQEVTGQYTEIDRTETSYLANRDREVFISDSPAPVLKGSMFLLIDGAYWLFPVWFAAAPFGNSYPPDTTYLHPYGYIQAYSVWNQYKGYNLTSPAIRGIGINIFAGSVKGLTDVWPDLLHRYTLTDLNQQTIDRYFLLISLEQDWKSCIWTATLIEVYNRVILKSYSDPLSFKYITQ